MRVRGTVKLLCEHCRKVKLQVTRDKAYYFIFCKKNPRVRLPGWLVGWVVSGCLGRGVGLQLLKGSTHALTC